MVTIVVSGHGELSTGILNAFQMIFGEDENVKAIPFYKGEGLPQMQEKFSKEVEKLDEGEAILFLVDVFGGTPYNAAAQVAYSINNADILTGVNLPILLEAASLKEQYSLSNLVTELKKSGAESIKVFTEEIQIIQTEDEEELL